MSRLSEERKFILARELYASPLHICIDTIWAEAYKAGQERMRERATIQAAEEAGEYGTDSDGWYICKSLSHQIEELELEEQK